MKVWRYIHPDQILLDVELEDKDSILRFLSETSARLGIVNDAAALLDGLKAREDTMSTGIGGGICFPHAATLESAKPAVFLLRLAQPVPYGSLDALPVDIVVGLVIPKGDTALHLQLLAGISRLCKRAEFLNAVRSAQDPHQLWQFIQDLESRMAFH